LCGRYYIEIDESELQDIVREAEKNLREYPEQLPLFKSSGEIFPTDIVPVQVGINQYLPMKWGFSNFNGRLVINARSETVHEKPMFKQPMLENRCLIPASGYYEWQKHSGKKTKYILYLPDGPMYLAGCYRQEKNSPFYSFVILTKPAAEGINDIHERMPVIIPKKHIKTWLYEGSEAIDYAEQELRYEAVM